MGDLVEPINDNNKIDTNNSIPLEGQYLIFFLCNEEYAIQIGAVKEIIGLRDVTKVPRTPDYIKGVMNLRGRIIPVMDLGLKFGLKYNEDIEERCIILVDDGNSSSIGLMVDMISEVVQIYPDKVEQPYGLGINLRIDYIFGIAKIGGRPKILLNIEAVLSDETC